jgi:hypothetical protein
MIPKQRISMDKTHFKTCPPTIQNEGVYLTQGGLYTVQVKEQPLRVEVIAGTLYLTQEDDPRDHVLSKNMNFQADKKGKVIIQALTPVTLKICLG